MIFKQFLQNGNGTRFRTSNGRLTVSMTWEEAQAEEAYDHMVEEILSSHKDEIIDKFLESHKDDIIDEFISERMTAYYRHHPNLTVPADTAIGEAQKLIEISPAASLVFSRSAVEITLRDVLLKPTDVITRHCGGLKNSVFDGADVPPPPMTMCTVPLVVSITSVAVAAGTGVSVAFSSRPRIGCERS
jgi:hypothetical protein